MDEEAKRDLKELMQQRAVLEGELAEPTARRQAAGVGMRDSLTDKDVSVEPLACCRLMLGQLQSIAVHGSIHVRHCAVLCFQRDCSRALPLCAGLSQARRSGDQG